MRKKLQIFVSSTYTDLIEERQAAVEAILKSGNIPAGMELFTAGDKSQLETIKRWIDESDIYMLILGSRYGSIEPISGKSYTEVEYDYVVNQNKPFFSVVLSDEMNEKKVKQYGSKIIETDNSEKYKQFKKKVLKNISKIVETQNDIKLAIHETLQDFKDRYEFTGWVHGNSEENNTNELLKENIQLRKELEKLKANEKSKENTKEESEDDFEEIYNRFQSIKKLKINNKEVPINDLIITYSDYLILGITNQYDISEIEQILFFNLMPKLELYDLAKLEDISGVRYRRYVLTVKGKEYAKYLVKRNSENV